VDDALVAIFDLQPPARPVPTLLKVLAAVFWVASAIRLPPVITHLIEPPPAFPSRAPVPDESILGDNQADPAAPTKVKTDMCKNSIENGS
jgi:hypothetical protein